MRHGNRRGGFSGEDSLQKATRKRSLEGGEKSGAKCFEKVNQKKLQPPHEPECWEERSRGVMRVCDTLVGLVGGTGNTPAIKMGGGGGVLGGPRPADTAIETVFATRKTGGLAGKNLGKKKKKNGKKLRRDGHLVWVMWETRGF